jgi:hypothetical protein
VPAIADVTAWLRAVGFVDVSVTRRPELPAAVWFTAVVA